MFINLEEMAADYFVSVIVVVLIVLIWYVKERFFGNRTAVSQLQTESGQTSAPNSTIPQSVNYHFTRQCNYKCGFCFHTAKTSFVLPLEEAKRGLKMLKEAGRYPTLFAV